MIAMERTTTTLFILSTVVLVAGVVALAVALAFRVLPLATLASDGTAYEACLYSFGASLSVSLAFVLVGLVLPVSKS